MPKSKVIFLRYLALTVLVLLPLFSFAQKHRKEKKESKAAREQDLIRYSSLSGVESSIDKATGWAVQNNGAWYSMDNIIPFPDQKSDRDNYGARKLGQDNFTKIELRKLMIGNKQYSVLIKMYRDGQYEFPLLKQDWEGFKSLDYYVFDSRILKKILPDNVEFNKSYAIDLHVFARGTIRNYTHKNWQSLLVGHVQDVNLGEQVNGWDLVIAVYPIRNDEKEVCRFRLIKTFRNKYLVSMYTSPNDWHKLFDRSFYQVKFYTFKNFIDGAKEDYINVYPTNGTAESPDPFQNYYNWGILKYQTGDFIKAIKYFNEALKIKPDTKNFMLFSYLGNAQSKLHRYEDALGSYDRALQLRPTGVMEYSNWVRNYFNRGVIKYYLNDMRGACGDWNKALELGFGTAYQYIQEYCHDYSKDKKKKKR